MPRSLWRNDPLLAGSCRHMAESLRPPVRAAGWGCSRVVPVLGAVSCGNKSLFVHKTAPEGDNRTAVSEFGSHRVQVRGDPSLSSWSRICRVSFPFFYLYSPLKQKPKS